MVVQEALIRHTQLTTIWTNYLTVPIGRSLGINDGLQRLMRHLPSKLLPSMTLLFSQVLVEHLPTQKTMV